MAMPNKNSATLARERLAVDRKVDVVVLIVAHPRFAFHELQILRKELGSDPDLASQQQSGQLLGHENHRIVTGLELVKGPRRVVAVLVMHHRVHLLDLLHASVDDQAQRRRR